MNVSARVWDGEKNEFRHDKLFTEEMSADEANAIIFEIDHKEYTVKCDFHGDRGLRISVDGQLIVIPGASNSIIVEAV